jgi:glutathione S-transferase
VPVLIDGDFTLPESNAIARYLDTLAGLLYLQMTQSKQP